jgi:hypothetical protein
MFNSAGKGSSAGNPGASKSTLFKKPTWIKAQTKVTSPLETSVDYFHRKGESLADIEARNALRREQEKAQRGSQQHGQTRDEDEHVGKRRRIQDGSEDDSRSEGSVDPAEDKDTLKELEYRESYVVAKVRVLIS